jgi:DHA3 family macrolide efflux protein-like MFS transporter
MTEPSRTSTFSVFRNRDFSFLWTGQLVSTIGNSLTSLAASIVVYRQTGSALSVGLMLMATALPTLFVGPIAGVFVDRMDRKRIMILADVLRAFLILLIPFLAAINIAWLYILVMLTSAVGQFFDPAHASVLPEIASDDELAAANSFIAISSFGATAVGFAAAGLIASQFDIKWAFYFDTLTFLLSALCIYMVRIKPLEVEGDLSVSSVVNNLREGVRFLVDNTYLRSLLIITVPVLFAVGLWNTLLLPFSEVALHATEFEFGVQEGMTSIGFVLGSFLMARIANRLREGQWIIIGYLIMGAVGLLYSQVVSIPIAIGLVMIVGFINAPGVIARKLIIQRQTPRELRGRVNSAFFVVRDVILLFGMAAAGLADFIDIRLLVLFCGIIWLGSGALAFVLPGLGKPEVEWRRALDVLRAAPKIPQLGVGKPATLADFDLLMTHLPVLGTLSAGDRDGFIQDSQVESVDADKTIIAEGETGDEVYFVLSGLAVASIPTEAGEFRLLSRMGPGDFFGEIAALTGLPRTADVVAREAMTLLQVPAASIKNLMTHPRFRYLFQSKLIERLSKTHDADLPRLMGWDQAALREIRISGDEGEART